MSFSKSIAKVALGKFSLTTRTFASVDTSSTKVLQICSNKYKSNILISSSAWQYKPHVQHNIKFFEFASSLNDKHQRIITVSSKEIEDRNTYKVFETLSCTRFIQFMLIAFQITCSVNDSISELLVLVKIVDKVNRNAQSSFKSKSTYAAVVKKVKSGWEEKQFEENQRQKYC